MEEKRKLRPILMILTVLYALNGIYIVVRQGVTALIERLARDPRVLLRYLRATGLAELVLFAAAVGICLLLAALFSEKKRQTPFFVLAGANLVLLAANAASRLFGDLYYSSLLGQLCCGICFFAGYALLARCHAGVRGIAWTSAAAVLLARLCAAFSVLSASMMDYGEPLLWKELYLRAAQLSTALNIVACVVQALCFLLLYFEYGENGMKSGGENEKEEPEQGA